MLPCASNWGYQQIESAVMQNQKFEIIYYQICTSVIKRIKESQNATFTVDTYSDTDFEGIVTAIYPKAVIQDNVVNYVATLKITHFKEKILRPEMTVTVTIYLEKKENVLTVPNNAIKREQGKTVVTVLDKNGKMDQRIIKTGYSSNGYVEILDGVRESEKVVL